MSEMELTADHLVVIGGGRLVADSGLRRFIEENSSAYVRVRSPRSHELAAALRAGDGAVSPDGDALVVRGLSGDAVGDIAAANGIGLHELSCHHESLEDVYTRLTVDRVEFVGGRDV
jgi:ABC-2 type transport system ATP-binding protein